MGWVNVEENEPGDMTLAQLRNRADDPNAPPEAFTMVSLRGTQALLVSANGIGRLVWIENGVLIDVSGEVISPRQVQELASQL